MTARIVPLDKFLLAQVIDDPADPLAAEILSGPQFIDRALVMPGLSYGMIDGAFPIAAAGLVPVHAGRAELWSVVTTHARPRHIVTGVRAMSAFLDKRQRDPAFRRIEMTVVAANCWASSFAGAMGFVREGLMRAFDPAARDHLLFARVKEG